MFKRVWLFTALFCCVLLFGASPKYVFLLIGDGMGENSRLLLLSQKPDSAIGTMGTPIPTGTLNAEGKCTDSAASGTAIACGIKTLNKHIGLDSQGRPVTSLAKILQSRGYKIGLVSSVALNDATPAAHAANRMRSDLIGTASDLYTNRFDFLGISNMWFKDDASLQHFINQGLFRADYAVSTTGRLEDLQILKKKKHVPLSLKKAQKHPIAVFASKPLVWGSNDDASKTGVPDLAGFTAMAAKVLKNSKGFFLMVEGGAIDMGNHHNDVATMLHEIREFDRAVAEALKFQAKHPDETLVIVTADHETGGLNVENFQTLRRGFADGQKLPMKLLNQKVMQMLTSGKSDAEILDFICVNVDLGKLSPAESQRLNSALQAVKNREKTGKDAMTGYGSYNPLVIEAFRVRDARNGIKYTTFGHTTAKVSTMVKGPGSELFREPLENSDIPHRISTAMLGDDKELSAGLTPLPFAPKAVDYVTARSASFDTLLFEFAAVGKVPQKLELRDAEGRLVKQEFPRDLCGYVNFGDLKPDSTYNLDMVKNDGSIILAKARTLPKPAGKKLFSFLVLSDMHLSPYGDIPFGRMLSYSSQTLENLVKYANAEKIPLIINPGDFADKSRAVEYQLIEKFMKPYTGLLLATPGNHDLKGYEKLMGNGAGITEFGGIQFVRLCTGGANRGFLGKDSGNMEAIKQFDPARPAVIFTHYQLKPDTLMTDKDRAIHDQDKAPVPEVQAMLDKLASAKQAVIYIGHKNTATDVKLGSSWQINCPQPTQFPCGYLLIDVYEDGLLQHYVPAVAPRINEVSRRLGGGTPDFHAKRDSRSFEVWNRFIPMSIPK